MRTVMRVVLAGGIVAAGQMLCMPHLIAGSGEFSQSPFKLAEKKLKQPPSQEHSKIIEGRRAAPGAYPYQIALIRSDAKPGKEFDGLMCGGTMIAPTWVLTAGHCVSDDQELVDAKSLNVYVGSNNFKNGDRIAVKSFIRHESYEATFLDFDVALLKLARPPKKDIKYQTIKFIDAPDESTVYKVGDPTTIIGWGATESANSSEALLEASVKTVDDKLCSTNIVAERAKGLDDELDRIVRRFKIDAKKIDQIKTTIIGSAGNLITGNMICAGDPAPTPTKDRVRDTCWGDSGGPLLLTTPTGPLQVGIVSWGEQCGLPEVFGVYTRVAKFADWIKRNARD